MTVLTRIAVRPELAFLFFSFFFLLDRIRLRLPLFFPAFVSFLSFSLSKYGTRFNLPLLVHLGESLAPGTQNAARVDWTEYVLDAYSKM